MVKLQLLLLIFAVTTLIPVLAAPMQPSPSVVYASGSADDYYYDDNFFDHDGKSSIWIFSLVLLTFFGPQMNTMAANIIITMMVSFWFNIIVWCTQDDFFINRILLRILLWWFIWLWWFCSFTYVNATTINDVTLNVSSTLADILNYSLNWSTSANCKTLSISPQFYHILPVMSIKVSTNLIAITISFMMR